MIETRHLAYFVAAARCMNITRAAASLRVAQPALTRAIHHLEGQLGVQLFHRVKNRISLTDAGVAFLADAETTLSQLENSVVTAQRASRGETGRLTIGFISTAGLAVMPGLVQRFRNRYPGPMIVLHEMGAADIESGLRNGSIDVGVSFGPTREREFLVRVLAPQRLLIALPAWHRLAGAKVIDLVEVKDEIFILPTYENAGTIFDAMLLECRRAGFQPRIGHHIVTTTALTTLGLTSAGLGVTLVPENVLPFAQKNVVLRPIRGSKITVGLGLMCRLHDRSSVVKNFLETAP